MEKTFGTDWWPEGAASPRLRLAAALALSPLALALVAAALAFGVYGMNLPDRDSVVSATIETGLTAVAAFTVFSFTFGLLAVLALWRWRRRGIFDFAVAGAVAGALFVTASAPLSGVSPNLAALLTFAAAGALMLMLVRAISGIRAPRPAPRP